MTGIHKRIQFKKQENTQIDKSVQGAVDKRNLIIKKPGLKEGYP